MKKIILFAIIILAAVALALPQIAAADGGPETWAEGRYTLGDGGVAATPSIYELSSNVFLYYTPDSTYTSYGLGSLHQSGNRSYATTNNTTLIYWNDKPVGDTSTSLSQPDPGATTPGGTAL